MAKTTNSGKQHFKVTMFFPLDDSEGNPFAKETWQWWYNGIEILISGFTDLGIVNGWWQGQSDRNRWIVTIVEGVREVDQLQQFLRLARKRFRQDTMYFEWHEVRFDLVK